MNVHFIERIRFLKELVYNDEKIKLLRKTNYNMIRNIILLIIAVIIIDTLMIIDKYHNYIKHKTSIEQTNNIQKGN